MSNNQDMLVDPELSQQSPENYVDAVVRRAGTSFFWAMRQLDAERRRALFAIYAFCREVDDIADSYADTEKKTEALDRWRKEIDSLYQGMPGHPITSEIDFFRSKYELRKEDFVAVIDGMVMDARSSVRIKDLSELELYCDRVACAVGRLCVRVFGLEEEEGRRLAHELGMALQITNILRDIAEDAARDRVYLPADWLEPAGAESESVQEIVTAPRFGSICDRLVHLAEAHYHESEMIMASASPPTVRPARMMMGAYKQILNRIKKRGWYDLNVRVRLTRLEKMIIAVRYGLLR